MQRLLLKDCRSTPRDTTQKPKTNKELDDDDKAFLAKKKAEQAAIKELQKTAASKGGFAKNKGGK